MRTQVLSSLLMISSRLGVLSRAVRLIVFSTSRFVMLRGHSIERGLNHNLYYIYIYSFSSKSEDTCFTFRIKFRYFIEFLQKCHSRFLFYLTYIDRSFARQFNLHELHSIIRDTHRSVWIWYIRWFSIELL
jgi:hypothetical protein